MNVEERILQAYANEDNPPPPPMDPALMASPDDQMLQPALPTAKPEPLYGGELSISNREELTTREKLQRLTEQVGVEYFGLDERDAVDFGKTIWGAGADDVGAPGAIEGMGFADLIGADLIFMLEEGYNRLKRGSVMGDRGDVAQGAAEIGIGAISAIPGGKAAVKVGEQVIQGPVKDFYEEAVKRWQAGKSPIPVGMSIEDVTPKTPTSAVIEDLTPGAVPVVEGAPSIAFREQALPTPIEGAKGPGKVGPGDIGKYWDDDYIARYGRQGDPTNPEDLQRAIDTATAEAIYQLRQADSGKGWYDKDISDTWEFAGQVFEELNSGLIMPVNPQSVRFKNGEEVSSEALRILTTAIAAPLSFGTRPKPNFNTALKVLDGWLSSGRIPDMNPETGKLWTMRNVSSQSLRLLQHMIDELGVEGTAEWLMSPHTVKELRDMKRAPGIWKDSASMSIPGKLDDTKLGAFILGRKGGPFFLNLNGVEDTTADLWFTRTWNRQFGRMTGPNLPANEVILNQPRATERGPMKEWNQSVATNLGETEQDSQAILWYFEQQLFNAMGQKSAKPSKFSDGAIQFRDEGGRGRYIPK